MNKPTLWQLLNLFIEAKGSFQKGQSLYPSNAFICHVSDFWSRRWYPTSPHEYIHYYSKLMMARSIGRKVNLNLSLVDCEFELGSYNIFEPHLNIKNVNSLIIQLKTESTKEIHQAPSLQVSQLYSIK